METALLALEDGTVFEGVSFGASTQRVGEVVFNTAITGYQEIFTDPSYCGQIVVLTNPQIGNYGSNGLDSESGSPYIEGLVVREISPVASNWRSDDRAEHFLAKHGIPVIAEIDTRRLVRLLRDRGAMRGVIATGQRNPDELIAAARQAPSMAGQNLISRVSTRTSYEWAEAIAPVSSSDKVPAAQAGRNHVVAYDFGIKRNILRHLVQLGSRVTVVPADASSEDVLALKPDGVFLFQRSWRSGASRAAGRRGSKINRESSRVWHLPGATRFLALRWAGRPTNSSLGTHGANHLFSTGTTGKVEITSQNHGFCVDPDSLSDSQVEITHTNLNDGTVEGFRHRSEPVFCVQYHPEAAPGPHDSHYLFQNFVKAMDEAK